MTEVDVVVAGAGNAALCAALAARGAGARVLVVEAAPRAEFGGNSAYTAGAMRVAYDSPEQIRRLIDCPDDEFAACDFGSYPAAQFVEDIHRTTDGRADEQLATLVAARSLDTLAWMRGHGVPFEPSYGQQAFESDGRWRFWGGLAVRVRGEGKGLVAALRRACDRAGVVVRCGARLTGVVPGRSITVADNEVIQAKATVLACGGFEANGDWRVEHLGPAWAAAKVRGTRFNLGDGIAIATRAGAARAGDWTGCHAVQCDRDAPDTGTLDVAHEYTRNSYQFGVVVNARGDRFLDEGADFRNYTYAAYGREVMAQPGGVAWQVFDAKVSGLLRREYARTDAAMVERQTLEQLGDAMSAPSFAATARAFNAAVPADAPFDPASLDRRGTTGVTIPKSNWALPLDTPPFRAYAVTCGITFTFGGLHVDASGRVLDDRGRHVPGLFAAGEIAGGLWHRNYPGGSGLTAGSVLGRAAGMSAAIAAAG